MKNVSYKGLKGDGSIYQIEGYFFLFVDFILGDEGCFVFCRWIYFELLEFIFEIKGGKVFW